MPKIYTKSGDGGDTSLPGGLRVSKDDLQVEATGALDELNAYLGLLLDHMTAGSSRTLLREVQKNLFVIGAHIAAGKSDPGMELPRFKNNDVTALEQAINEIQETLPPLKNFILPGGHPTVSICHIARSITRRAERRVVSYSKISSLDDSILCYLNRLSDFLFALARDLAKERGIEETVWRKEE